MCVYMGNLSSSTDAQWLLMRALYISAVVNFYQDDSDAVFLGLSYDLRPNSLKVQILIGLLVGNVGLWPVKKFVEESNTRFEKWRAT